jgi:hypothetical protein
MIRINQSGRLQLRIQIKRPRYAGPFQDLYPTHEATVGNFEKAKGSMARLTAIGCPSIDFIENRAGAGARPS